MFFDEYFSKHYREGIPMGKYGCALLIKLVGPESLKFLSLGKLIYLINQALSDDYLRYYNRKIV